LYIAAYILSPIPETRKIDAIKMKSGRATKISSVTARKMTGMVRNSVFEPAKMRYPSIETENNEKATGNPMSIKEKNAPKITTVVISIPMAEVVSGRMDSRIAEVQDKIEELKRAKFEIEGALRTHWLEPIETRIVLDYVKDLKEFLDESNIFERRAFLRSFVESIDVDDHQIALNYTLPLPPENAKQEAFSVLGIVPTGPLFKDARWR
jgi:hypothetical protein